jgi:polysaccharide pyruvyl transferase WcaK-like protein
MRLVFLDHGEAYGNLGDEAMLQSALRRLSARLGPARFVVPRQGHKPLPSLAGYDVQEVPSPFSTFMRLVDEPHHPWWARASAGIVRARGIARELMVVELLARSGRLAAIDADFAAFQSALRQCDLFYGVGAADFNDFFARGVAYKTWLYRMARRAVPVVAVAAQGFGPLDNPELRALMRKAFSALDFLSFRDHSFSAAFTQTLGRLPCRTATVGDEAFALPAADAAKRDEAIASSGLGVGDSFVAVHWRATDYTQETRRFIPDLARACDLIARHTGAKLLFIPMSYDEHSGHDIELVGALREKMSQPGKLYALPVQHDVAVIKAVIGRALFTAGLSYHVHVFGLTQGRAALILYTGEYYRYKSEGLVGFYGPPSAAIDLARTSATDVEQTIAAISAGAEAARPSIEDANARIRAVNDWTIEMAVRRLEEIGR